MKHCRPIIALSIALTLSFAAAAQSYVTGKVTDSNGEPVAGAAVFYQGTSESAMTDAEGNYRIKVINGKDLTFSLFGMKDQTVKVKGPGKVDVTLESDSFSLEDAVVIGYGKQLRRDLTGSVASIKSDELKKTGSATALGALQGHVAGLNITSESGEPGAGFSIKIRGNNSINAGTSPLFVIDGVQIDINSSEVASSSATGTGTYDPLSFLNPSDIESVEVLKDASATAIYGAQGANGVVIITTKSGPTGKNRTNVSLDASWGIQTVPKRIEMTDKQQYINYRFSRTDYGWAAYGVDLDGDGIPDAPLDATQYTNYDWQDLLYRNALVQNYNIGVRSNTGKGTQIMASLGFMNQDGLVINNDFKRINAHVKLDHKFGRKENFKIGASAQFSRSISNGAVSSGGGELGNSGLIQMIYLERPIQFWTDADTDYDTGWTSLMDLVSKETFRKSVYDRLVGNFYFEWDIIDCLKFRASASGNTSTSNLKEFYSVKSRWGKSRNGYGNNKNVSTYSVNANATLTFNKTFNKTHHFDAMAGVEASSYNNDSMKISGYDFIESSTGAYNLSKAAVMEAPDQNVSRSTRMSAFCRANYNYKSRYYATVNFRADGSSKFYAGNRVGYFPSASIAWRPSEESWMSAARRSWLDDLKIRASIGASGNDRIGSYASLATLTTNYYANSGVEILGMAPSTTANPNLKWETTYQYNVGVDMSMFKERVNINVDLYNKDTRDMLYKATLSAQSGFTEQWQNLGRVTNKGIEVSLNTVNIDKRNFSWTSTLTFDMSRNKVIDIGGVEYTSVNISHGVLANDISRIVVGEPIGIGWGYVWDGNYQLSDFRIYDKLGHDFSDNPEVVTSANLDKWTFVLKEGVTTINGVNVLPGDRKYKDLDGDNVVTTLDRTKISDSNPDFTMGFSNTFHIWDFDLTLFFEGVYGRDIMNEFKLRSESGLSGSTQYNSLTKAAWEGHWTPENGSTTYSRLMNQTNTYVSSYYVEDGSFLRLKTINLGYNLPRKICQKIRFDSLRVSFCVDNAFVLTRYSGMDPDVSSSNVLFTGFDRMSYPKARVFTFGINANF